MWNKLIYISIDFMLNDFEFKEQFLYDRTRNKSSEIKQFAVELIKEKVIDYDSLNYKKGIYSLPFEFLDDCAEYITYKINQEIYFYEKFKPLQTLQIGLFGNGLGIKGEYLIPISINISNKDLKYKDEFTWDLLDSENLPETFAQQIASEENLPKTAQIEISLEIRKQIRNYVFELFQNFSLSSFLDHDITNKSHSKHKKSNKKHKKHFLFLNQEISLTDQLGKKRVREGRETGVLPSFLQNTKKNIDIFNSYAPSNISNENLIKSDARHIVIKKKVVDSAGANLKLDFLECEEDENDDKCISNNSNSLSNVCTKENSISNHHNHQQNANAEMPIAK